MSLLFFAFCAVCLSLPSCGDKTNTHTHSFKNAWTSDAEHHWHTSDCEHGEEIADKSEHKWDSGTVVVAVSCDRDGETVYTCTVCDYKKTEVVKATGHSYGKLVAKTEATCVKEGFRAHYFCAGCKTYLTASVTQATYDDLVIPIAPNAHNFKKYSAKEPTATEAGWEEYYTCLSCRYTTYAEIPATRKLVLTKDTDISELFASLDMKLGYTIEGSKQSVKLILPTSFSLTGPLTIKNVTLSLSSSSVIYANGHRLYIDSDVRSESTEKRLTVYGGSNNTSVNGTDITLLGGHYSAVFGGGNGTGGKVNGNTNVVFGGNANLGDTTDDDSSNFVDSRLFGGSVNSAVTGSTNITLSGNAVIAYISGVGRGDGGQVKTVNINIEGGNVMNVFGGSLSSKITDVTVNITMTGGKAESVFGGSIGSSMVGNANISLLGGEVTRRVFTGCYNDKPFFGGYKTDHRLIGTAKLTIGKDMKLCTGSGLSFDNGIYCGSRYSSHFSEEIIILEFLDGCYNTFKSDIMNESYCTQVIK